VRRAVIIGGGPAGLTAASELLARTDVCPIVLEAGDQVGGISKTVRHGTNRIDLGGHRFFSKSDRVMDWWLGVLPLQGLPGDAPLTYQNRVRTIAGGAGPDPAETDAVMLLRPRRSRIYHRGQFFDYPLRATPDTLWKLGLGRAARIGASYARATLRPRPEVSLEDFLINRFGRSLYLTFFKEYTEKVWGVPCAEISAEWGAQRIKGLDLRKAAEGYFRRVVPGPPVPTETSLIEQFLYPKYGPGQLWEAVAARVTAGGGEVHLGWRVVSVTVADGRATGVVAEDREGHSRRFDGDHVFSTMPIQELVRALDAPVPEPVRAVSDGLMYRDFITVGLDVDHLRVNETVGGRRVPVRDNWIYVQEPGVHVGRIQVFNNWSPWMVGDPSRTWIGLEYFCAVGDDLWSRSDADLVRLATEEADRIGILDARHVRDGCVVRVPKTYPAYFGSYGQFDTLRAWLDGLQNLWLIGRNGMHRYNNQDHSMLTAMTAVDQIAAGVVDKSAIWAVNTEMEYQEG
jgi:protoporphyrinogen oxidase